MPRNVRNFWVDAEIDGRSTDMAGGPVAKDGGLDVRFKIRNEGCVENALTVSGYARADGSLKLRVFDARGNEVYAVETNR